MVTRLGPSTRGLGIEMLLVRGRLREPDGSVRDRVIRFFPSGSGVVIEVDDPPDRPLMPYDEASERIVSARRRGTLHPAEIVKMVAPAHSGDGAPDGDAPPNQPAGDFTEHDLDADGRLVPVDRPLATNPAGIVVGVVRNYTERYPEGMERVTLLGDPTKSLGSLAEPECRRIIAALDLAEERGVPLEWFALSAGAKIAMDSGTENMDWIAAVLRRIIEYTQRGGELNVVIAGINVGAQPYWNAEATMLMHTRGHPGDDAGQRHGADRKAGPRLLGRRFGGGQLRDRRLRADHGAERPGPVLGPGSRRRLPAACSTTTSMPTSRPTSGSRAALRRRIRSSATSATCRSRHGSQLRPGR